MQLLRDRYEVADLTKFHPFLGARISLLVQ
jgi:hypothetical protein